MPVSATPADEAGVIRACTAAAEELLAARRLIDAQRKEIDAATARLDLEKERLALMAEKNQLQIEQLEALRSQIAAMEKAKGILLQLQDRQQQQIASLEARLAKARRRTLLGILGGVLAGAILRR